MLQRALVSWQLINSCTEVWQGVCRELGWRIDESIPDAPHWKAVYLKAKLRMVQLQDQEAFETSSLIGHSARVYALYYKDGLLCTGTARRGLSRTHHVDLLHPLSHKRSRPNKRLIPEVASVDEEGQTLHRR